MTTPTPNRNPLMEALAQVAPGVSALVALVTALGSAGVFSAAQVAEVASFGDKVTEAATPSGPIAIAVGVVIGLMAGGAHLFATMKAGKNATAQTTPVTSPRDVDGAPLVRADGLPLGGNPVDTRSPALN